MLIRDIAGQQLPAIGLGCMNLSHAYGTPPDEAQAARVLHNALDLGVRHFDTAALYGFGRNESLLGKVLKGRRKDVFLASKCGMTGVDGKRVIDGRPATLVKTLDAALGRLQTDHIDLYYLHRLDRNVPVEESIGAMARMAEAGKIGALGLSEVSSATLRRAHAVHPVAAVQTELSLWSRNAEIAVLDACRSIGAAFVAFSPLARGFLADPKLDPAAFPEGDIRLGMPRFQAPHFERNRLLADEFATLARDAGCTPAQLALAWVIGHGEHVHVIPGTTSGGHLEENVRTATIGIDTSVLQRAAALINETTVSGPRYPQATQREIDTEEFELPVRRRDQREA